MQNDGKIIVAGELGEAATYKATATRYNADGSLDASFANNGSLVIPIGNAKSFATDVALQDDGKIVMAAYTWNDVKGEVAAFRLNTDGSLDPTFGDQGVEIERANQDGQELIRF
nr:delta-60 repeat domain-containing protein [uncultured Brumimicrobium sp.]